MDQHYDERTSDSQLLCSGERAAAPSAGGVSSSQFALCGACQVLRAVLHILHNNLCHLEVCVDSWPTFTTAICYRQKQHFTSSSGRIPDICTVFTKKS
ncbi:uncharacterized protein ACO6RY_04295 [Pungitius sinensis]